MDEFTDEIALAGWDPRFARVLAKAVANGVAVAIIDANGADGGQVYENTDLYSWDEGGWCDWSSSGGLGGGWGSTGSGGIAYAAGEGEPGEEVLVEFRGERHRVQVQPSGYWVFAAAGEYTGDVPERVR